MGGCTEELQLETSGTNGAGLDEGELTEGVLHLPLKHKQKQGRLYRATHQKKRLRKKKRYITSGCSSTMRQPKNC